ncbi:MAG: DJ-1/PfpI family protein [Chloroflexota bacterium]
MNRRTFVKLSSLAWAAPMIALPGVLARTASAAAPARTAITDPAGATVHQADAPRDIAMLIYPGFTALDMVGPQSVLGGLGGRRIHLVWKTTDPVVSDTGIPILPTTAFADCPENLEILFVPGGGRPTIALMDDRDVLDFLTRRAATAEWVTSVCTGSLILGAAGLLRGYRAASHWVFRDLLALLDAVPVAERVVEDRNRITGGGVTAGIDFGLRIAARLRGEAYARILQLNLEYAPEPPFRAGTPEQAGPEATAFVRNVYAQILEDGQQAAQRARARFDS